MISHSQNLIEKKPLIMLTNRCNLSCGGCNQLCPSIRPKRKWDIPLAQLYENISTLSAYYHDIEIFGGEPTCHPKWDKIKEVLWSFPHLDFRIFTNLLEREGYLPENEGNIYYHCDNAMRAEGTYLPTLMAPIDIYKIQNKAFYWGMAQKYCWMWNKNEEDDINCSGILYDNRSYLCQPAGALERMLGTDFGWSFVPGQNPFDHSDEEIVAQATEFCYRCAFACDNATKGSLIQQQRLDQPSLTTWTNQAINHKTQLVTEEELTEMLPRSVIRIRRGGIPL